MTNSTREGTSLDPEEREEAGSEAPNATVGTTRPDWRGKNPPPPDWRRGANPPPLDSPQRPARPRTDSMLPRPPPGSTSVPERAGMPGPRPPKERQR
jgi:hypothetical protein